MKYKLSFKDQIQFLNDKNILIDIDNIGDNINQTEVFNILKERNYLFKLKVFGNCYDKDKKGLYKNLDFKTLHRLSILDTKLRALILEISLVCEHLLKTKINYLCTTNINDDGYDSVRQYLKIKTPNEINRYKSNKTNYYTKRFLDKYINNLAVWNLIEILTFNEAIEFYNFYIEKYYEKNKLKKLRLFELVPIKNLRNAAAHNNCILHLIGEYLHKLNNKYTSNNKNGYSYNIKDFLCYHNMNQNLGRKFLIHDLLCLIYVFNKLCPKGQLRDYIKLEINKFFDKCESKDWFKTPLIIKSRYLFIKKAIKKMLL